MDWLGQNIAYSQASYVCSISPTIIAGPTASPFGSHFQKEAFPWRYDVVTIVHCFALYRAKIRGGAGSSHYSHWTGIILGPNEVEFQLGIRIVVIEIYSHSFDNTAGRQIERADHGAFTRTRQKHLAEASEYPG